MDNNMTNDATMGPELIKNYQQILLNNVLAQKLEQNEIQTKTVTDYKNRHKKVIEGLQVYPLSVSENCMVPIGKRAFMKGKLSHTNEVLASLGDGYFAKYSASQAIALCNRRIAWADEMLKSLETERNLYEMRQYLPLGHDVFGEKNRKDITEHWTENKLDEWRVQHRQREKEFRQRLKLREKEKTDVRTEEDLFKRLDELEIEEELEDEMYRLEAKQKELYGDDFEDGEAYDETEEDTSDSDQVTTEIIQEEFKKLKDMQMNKITSSVSSINSDPSQDKILDPDVAKNKEYYPSTNFIQNISSSESCSPKFREDSSKESKDVKEKRRISFAEPCVVENNAKEEISTSEETCLILKEEYVDKDQDKDEDTIKIEFSHSLHNPDIPETNSMEIKSPVDIYKVFSTPKSILKRSPNDMIYDGAAVILQDSNSDTEDSTEDEDEYTKQSAYSFVLKDEVQEKVLPMSNTTIKKDEKKIVSRFKFERAGKKK